MNLNVNDIARTKEYRASYYNDLPGIPLIRSQKVSVLGVTYSDMNKAGKTLNVAATTVKRRCMSENEQDWFFITDDYSN